MHRVALRTEREIYVINEAQVTWNWWVFRLFLNKEEKRGTTEDSGEGDPGLWALVWAPPFLLPYVGKAW